MCQGKDNGKPDMTVHLAQKTIGDITPNCFDRIEERSIQVISETEPEEHNQILNDQLLQNNKLNHLELNTSRCYAAVS